MKRTKTRRRGRILRWIGAVLVAGWAGWRWGYPVAFSWYTGTTNPVLTYTNSRAETPVSFERIAADLTRDVRRTAAEAGTATEPDAFARRIKAGLRMETRSAKAAGPFPHIKYFRDAGILQYTGPETCLTCHAAMKIRGADGSVRTADTLEDVLGSVHFNFQKMGPGFSTHGYDGREVNATGRPIPVGKIDRACGIPGSFSWTGWAAKIRARPHGKKVPEERSEGCGQCHIGGNTHPATERMMPIGDVPATAKHGIDCLICHSAAYDLNERVVIEGPGGTRWNQDRSLKAALAVGRPAAANCLLCHQHNLGGDLYPRNAAAKAAGRERPRLLHAGAKRGSAFHPADDVHAAAGMNCTDCHVPQGHAIPRGKLGTDLVANDLPGTAVECASCHTNAPHVKDRKLRAILNGHVDRIACETCHITKIQPNAVVLRDWIHPTWDPAEGVWTPTDILRSGKPNIGYTFLWFNGEGTFLANALGTNPTPGGTYDPLMQQMSDLDRPEIRALVRPAVDRLARQYGFDRETYLNAALRPLTQLTPDRLAERRRVISDRLSPLAMRGKSRLYPFRLFNAIMYEDMGNQGPFGAMILPFDYATYYETGKPEEAMKKAISHPIVRRMYQWPFKLYMMDEFMHYFGVKTWRPEHPLRNGKLHDVETHWMRQMGTLMVNHGIQKKGRACIECHASKGKSLLDFRRLGYPEERARELENPPELKLLEVVAPVAAAR